MYTKLKILLACLCLSLLLSSCDRSQPTQSGYIQFAEGQLFFQKFGTGEPILIVHGGPGLDHSYLLPQMLELAKDHELIFYDQRGSGNSLQTKIDTQHINLEQFTKDLETLRLALGLKKFILLGHSWGGLLAMDYATKYPDTLSALILITSAPADYAGQQAFVQSYQTRTMPIKDKITALSQYAALEKLEAQQINDTYRTLFSVYFYDPKKAEQLTLNMSKASALSGFKVMNVMAQTSWLQPKTNLFPALKNLKVPTLVIAGQEDIVPVKTATAIQAAIPHAKISYLEHCGHFPYIEQPALLWKTIRTFLQDNRGE